MADEVPLDILGQLLVLQAKLLFVALTEDALSLGIGGLDVLSWVELGDGHQAHALRQRVENLVKMTFDVVIHYCSYSGLSASFKPFLYSKTSISVVSLIAAMT